MAEEIKPHTLFGEEMRKNGFQVGYNDNFKPNYGNGGSNVPAFSRENSSLYSGKGRLEDLPDLRRDSLTAYSPARDYSRINSSYNRLSKQNYQMN